MKPKKIDGVEVWKDFEDQAARLGLNVIERAVYSYLLLHTRVKSGQNSYRNLVSCCAACNWQKKDHAAEVFLRQLYREGRLSAKDLSARLQAVQDLAAGK